MRGQGVRTYITVAELMSCDSLNDMVAEESGVKRDRRRS